MFKRHKKPSKFLLADQATGNLSTKTSKVSVRAHLKEKRTPAIIFFIFFIFFISLVMPFETNFKIGSLWLSPYRIFLILVFFPALKRYLSQKVFSEKLIDCLVWLHVFWVFLSLTYVHDFFTGVESGGVYMLESAGAYLIARAYILSEADFKLLIKVWFFVVMALLPLAFIESFTGVHVIHRFFGYAGSLGNMEPRLGLDRAFGPFQHPILYGIFCASSLGAVFYALDDNRLTFKRIFRFSIVFFAGFLSLSTGPIFSMITQVFLMGWEYFTRRVPRRWVLLACLLLAGWITVSTISNRTPFHVFIWYFSFSIESSYNRILIWEYGTAEVARHPIFGIGFNEWLRPSYMSASMDNFWLLGTVRYGLPSLVFLFGHIILVIKRLSQLTFLDESVHRCRVAWLVMLVGFFFAGASAHLWDANFVLFFFMLGSVTWILNDTVSAKPVK